jgi:hypothetical protein
MEEKRKKPNKISDEFNPDVKTNKWGANQYREDPRQRLCWEFYVSPKSKTFGNAKQSAIRAGYSPKSAGLVTQENWFISKYKNIERVSKAEKVLDEILEMSGKILKLQGSGEDASIIEILDPQLLRIKQDTAKFYLERIAKRKYSLRNEVTGKGGEPIKYSLTEDEQQRITKAIRGIVKYTSESSNKD